MKDLVVLKEYLVCKDGNTIDAGTQFAVDSEKDGKYKCFSDPATDDSYLLYINKELVDVVGKTNSDIDDFLKNFS